MPLPEAAAMVCLVLFMGVHLVALRRPPTGAWPLTAFTPQKGSLGGLAVGGCPRDLHFTGKFYFRSPRPALVFT